MCSLLHTIYHVVIAGAFASISAGFFFSWTMVFIGFGVMICVYFMEHGYSDYFNGADRVYLCCYGRDIDKNTMNHAYLICSTLLMIYYFHLFPDVVYFTIYKISLDRVMAFYIFYVVYQNMDRNRALNKLSRRIRLRLV